MARTVSYPGIRCDRDTDKAILVEIDGEEHWIPKSQIDDDSDVYKAGTSGKLVITEWIATQKGLL